MKRFLAVTICFHSSSDESFICSNFSDIDLYLSSFDYLDESDIKDILVSFVDFFDSSK